jgi:hypothetical protein
MKQIQSPKRYVLFINVRRWTKPKNTILESEIFQFYSMYGAFLMGLWECQNPNNFYEDMGYKIDKNEIVRFQSSWW